MQGVPLQMVALETNNMPTAPPLASSRGSVFRQQAFGHFLSKASASRLAALLPFLEPTALGSSTVSLTMLRAGSTAYKLTPPLSTVLL